MNNFALNQQLSCIGILCTRSESKFLFDSCCKKTAYAKNALILVLGLKCTNFHLVKLCERDKKSCVYQSVVTCPHSFLLNFYYYVHIRACGLMLFLLVCLLISRFIFQPCRVCRQSLLYFSSNYPISTAVAKERQSL